MDSTNTISYKIIFPWTWMDEENLEEARRALINLKQEYLGKGKK